MVYGGETRSQEDYTSSGAKTNSGMSLLPKYQDTKDNMIEIAVDEKIPLAEQKLLDCHFRFLKSDTSDL